jgi:hypothetical protein
VHEADACATPFAGSTNALVNASPLPTVPCPCATASARTPGPLAWLSARKENEQLEPSLPAHAAPASAYSPLAATRLDPAHSPPAPAVQSDREVAVFVPCGDAARALPSVWVVQPVPAQLAVTSAKSFAADPPVAAVQSPAAAQVAVADARTPSAPTALAVAEARVAQPPSLPSSQVAEATRWGWRTVRRLPRPGPTPTAWCPR